MSQAMAPISSVFENPVDELAPLKKLSAHIFKYGAVLTCPKCGRSSDKTADEMVRYMRKWPRCCGTPADVRLK